MRHNDTGRAVGGCGRRYLKQSMEKWFIVSRAGNYTELGREYGVSPVLARLMRNRGISGRDQVRNYLEGGVELFNDPGLLPDMDRCVEELVKSISRGSKIRIIGDYDIDGVCSIYILFRGLRRAGACVDWRIPHRIRDGYGLNERLIREAASEGTDLIITCDNGISARAETRLACELGMKILVTDHHAVPYHMEEGRRVEELPMAEAVVDPHRSACFYPFKNICGAVTAWKVVLALYDRMGIEDAEEDGALEMAAFATVGDVMELSGENRAIVREGLKRLENTGIVGMKALIRACSIEGKTLTPYHLGFVLGPCVNAAGRLRSADMALRLFLEEDEGEAMRRALELTALNEERKAMTEKGVEEAMQMALSEGYANEKVLVLPLYDCHESIAGIVAGKVREYTGKPVFIICSASLEGQKDDRILLKGSGRSIENYNMYEEMLSHRELFEQFGGHAAAAGLTIAQENLERFRQEINAGCSLTWEDLVRKVRIDMQLPLGFVSLELAEELSGMEPFGNGNEPPLFAQREVSLYNARVFGSGGRVLKCRARDNTGEADAVYFGNARELMSLINSTDKINIAYEITINEYRGIRRTQIRIKNYQPGRQV